MHLARYVEGRIEVRPYVREIGIHLLHSIQVVFFCNHHLKETIFHTQLESAVWIV